MNNITHSSNYSLHIPNFAFSNVLLAGQFRHHASHRLLRAHQAVDVTLELQFALGFQKLNVALQVELLADEVVLFGFARAQGFADIAEHFPGFLAAVFAGHRPHDADGAALRRGDGFGFSRAAA